MVFESVPVYLDPLNWQQQVNQQQQNITADNSIHLLPSCPPPASQQQHQFNAGAASLGGHMGNGSGGNMLGSIRPGSMVDRARLAKLPLPEAGLKCPRCESTNTKFCYFNNYSLSQPRHFCKACRRYWTRGGALRSVPVGGGCRRNNKRSGKSSRRSGSPVSTMERRGGGGGGGIGSRSGGLSSSTAHDHHHHHRLNTATSGTSHSAFHPPQLTYLPSFQNLGGQDYLPRDIGSLNLGAIPPPPSMADTGGGGGDGGMNFNDAGSLTQAHRFPFLSDLETHQINGLYSLFDQSTEGNLEPAVVADGSCGGGLIRDIYQTNNKGLDSGCIISSQITTPSSSSVKMEGIVNHQGLINSSKSNILLGLDNQGMNNNSSNNEDDQQQYNWSGSCTAGTWTDLSSFTQPSSTSHHLL